MNIDQVSALGGNSKNTAPPGTDLGQDDFLKLLVAQMKNQDPTNPADNSEFLSQMAQFSMVSGIDDLNTSFNGVSGTLYSAQAMQAAGLVGRDVLVDNNSILVDGEDSVSGVVAVDYSGASTVINVRNEIGELVDTFSLGNSEAGNVPFTWSARDSAGASVVSGQYSFTALPQAGSEEAAFPVSLFHQVDSVSVDRSNASILLHLHSGQSAGLSQISQYK